MKQPIPQPSLRFGANYIPSKNWLHSWLDWDRNSIREDLDAISSLGMDHIRAHLLWPYFQPNEEYVCAQSLERLEELLDICDACDLDVEITVLTGWISGFFFFPPFKGGRNMFTDSGLIEAQKNLFRALAERIASHPRFLGFDLGNELSVLAIENDEATAEQCDGWMHEIMSLCEQIAPSKFHVNGVDHIPWFCDKTFSRAALATEGAATSLHTWIFFSGAMDRYKPMDTGCTALAEYNIELAHAYALDRSRKVWIQEFGASRQWMPEEQIPDFAEETIRHASSCKNVWGFTWWCSHDINRRFRGFAELEYDLGLFTVKNEPKPVAKRIAQLIKEFKTSPPQPVSRPQALVFPEKLIAAHSRTLDAHNKAGWIFGEKFMDMLKTGERPAVVLAERMNDEEYLCEREIESVREIC